MPEINKSSRHSKITGDFAEALVLYMLSKHGFECAKIDHTGIDLLARNPTTKELMGISVKSRSRAYGKETQHLNIPNDNFQKVETACGAFGCMPYFAIVIDRGESIIIFILSQQKLLEYFPLGKAVSTWKMREKYLQRYREDKEVYIIEFKSQISNWWVEDLHNF